MDDTQVQIFNNCNFSINVYSNSTVEDLSSREDISANIYDYRQKHTLLESVQAHGSATLSLEGVIFDLVVTREEDLFPISSHAVSTDDYGDDDDDKEICIREEDLNRCKDAWEFYELFHTQPYHPTSLKYHRIFTDSAKNDLNSLTERIEGFFQEHGYSCGLVEFQLVSFWAYTYLYAYQNHYYVYQGGNYREFMGFLLDNRPLGILRISANTAVYTPYEPGNSRREKQSEQIPLFYKHGALVKEDVDIEPSDSLEDFKGWTLTLHNFPSEEEKVVACFMGKIEGIGGKEPVIVQPHEIPSFPWWVFAYDVAKICFFTVEVGMGLYMVFQVLKATGQPIALFGSKMSKLFRSVFNKITKQGKYNRISSEPEPEEPEEPKEPKEPKEPGVEEFAKVSQKTFVNVVKGLGRWVLQSKVKIFTFLVTNATLAGAFEGIRKVLDLWEKKTEEGLNSLAPQEFLGLGLLVSYMTDFKNSLEGRWNVLSDYVQHKSTGVKGLNGRKDLINQQLAIIACIFEADTTPGEISWSQKQEKDLIARMARYAKTEDQYKVYSELLANYQIGGKKGVPIRIGCSAVNKHLTKLLTASNAW